MNNLYKLTNFLKEYLPMFFLLCFSGNPFVTHQSYSKSLLVGYTLFFLIYTLFIIDLQTLKRILVIFFGLSFFIFIIIFFQKTILGFVSYPGVFGYILKIILGLLTLHFYQYKKIDFIDSYIKTLAFLALISIPFFILNQFTFIGLESENGVTRSLFIHTSIKSDPDSLFNRNCGMFWEPGAFSGYLLLALVFIALKNRKFQIGPYGKSIFWILTALITTISTTGFIILGIIMILYAWQNYRWGRIIVIPFVILVIFFAYSNLDFMKEKIEKQFSKATEMDENDVSTTRFGALKMDLQYIKSQPLIGNGLHVKTRFRFHPEIKGDIGHGNGMSNFLANWGIPFFTLWIYCVYKFTRNISHSLTTSLAALFIIILILQGEQFLNFPLFSSFFIMPFIYQNILSQQNKIHIIKSFID